ncbi:MAG: histidinol dehydrogenase [Mycobacteriales bacterium]|nr:MAG: histidinol dehydrogenase [Pseudonocardiales bacterium]
MLRRTDLREARGDVRALLPRAVFDVDAAAATVAPILAAVRQRGSEAVLEFCERYDGVRPPALRVPARALTDALAALDPDVRAAVTTSIERVRAVHEAQRRHDVTVQVAPGGTVTERFVPVARVGLYVPGGLAPLVSSVLMNVVPARVAGVGSIAVASPPQREHGGLPHPAILGACALLGVHEVYAVGGAQAIAMFSYGVSDCPAVDLVTGPGNVYVVAAKRLLRGTVGIDAEAGTTEIAVLADDSADPGYVAADLISQAEHDPAAAALLVTDSSDLADAVDAALESLVPQAKHAERIAIALTAPQSGVALVRDLVHGVEVANAYAAEHLEVITRDPEDIAARVTSAGCVFVGPHAPVSLGDYCAGSNHVLPTGGTARHTGGLSVQSFLRGIHVVRYDAAALAAVADAVIALADAEDLPAHGGAVRARLAP